MNERLKKLAELAGFTKEFAMSWLWLADNEELERFAELVCQDEREACAKLCETMGDNFLKDDEESRSDASFYCAKEIRARGNRTKTSKDICGND